MCIYICIIYIYVCVYTHTHTHTHTHSLPPTLSLEVLKPLSRAPVPRPSGSRDQFRGRQFYHRRGWGNAFGTALIGALDLAPSHGV